MPCMVADGSLSTVCARRMKKTNRRSWLRLRAWLPAIISGTRLWELLFCNWRPKAVLSVFSLIYFRLVFPKSGRSPVCSRVVFRFFYGLALFRQTGFLQIINESVIYPMTTSKIDYWKQKVLDGHLLDEAEALSLAGETDKEALYEAAHELTRHFLGNKFDTCSIINAKSGNCSEDCRWCAQSGHYPTQVTLYPLLSAEECVRHAVYNRRQGIRRFALVTSGKRVSDREMETIVATVGRIKQACDIHCCASLGLLTRSQLQALYDSGVENYHCNIETAPSYFRQLCTTHTTAQKLETIRLAREIGFRICCGGIIGMGETWQQRIEMAVLLQKEGILSIPLNLLQPIPATPLEQIEPLSEADFLTTVALFRFINPKAYLRFSGGRARLSEAAQRKALHIGINSAIVGDLLTTIGSRAEADKALFRSEGYSLTENTDWAQ